MLALFLTMLGKKFKTVEMARSPEGENSKGGTPRSPGKKIKKLGRSPKEEIPECATTRSPGKRILKKWRSPGANN